MEDESFFEDATVESLAAANVAEILKLEDREAARILKLYQEVRRDLRDRLEAAPRGSFTAQQFRGTLVQIERAIVDMNGLLGREMRPAALAAARESIAHLGQELSRWNQKFAGAVMPLNIDAVRIASDQESFLFNRYEASIDAYGAGLRSRFAQGLAEAVAAELPMGEVMDRVGRTFRGEEWKLQQIVRTELHNVYGQSKLEGMKDLVENEIPDLMKTLFHPMDKRTGEDSKRLNRSNPIVPVDEPFVETSTGKRLEYMAPPNRPNDRAILIPYRRGWA